MAKALTTSRNFIVECSDILTYLSEILANGHYESAAFEDCQNYEKFDIPIEAILQYLFAPLKEDKEKALLIQTKCIAFEPMKLVDAIQHVFFSDPNKNPNIMTNMV